jgi:transcriptional regulator with XRE-family HTH domain
MSTKVPNSTDKHVGSRVRMRRVELHISQEKLGDQLGVTFQQVQKYEKGGNRIGASRLQHIAHILQVPVAFFFEGAPHLEEPSMANFKDCPVDYVSDFATSSDGLALIRAFTQIKNAKVRRQIVRLVEELTNWDDD